MSKLSNYLLWGITMPSIKSVIQKNKHAIQLRTHPFYTYKNCPYVEDSDRPMRRFEINFRPVKKSWLCTDENGIDHQR